MLYNERASLESDLEAAFVQNGAVRLLNNVLIPVRAVYWLSAAYGAQFKVFLFMASDLII